MSTSKQPASPARTAFGASAAEWATERGDKWSAKLDGMEATLAPIDAQLIGALDLAAPLRIADVGCGGGATTFALHDAAPAGSDVQGFDISPALVDAARERARIADRAVAFHLADVSTAPAPASPFDRLVSRFGVMFYDDPLAAFTNLSRWLAPDGAFAFAVWGAPAENPWVMAARDVTAQLVDLPKPDPDGPGPFRYARADAFLQLLTRAGFADVRAQAWRGAVPVGGGLPAPEAARFVLASFAFGDLLVEAGPERFDAALRELTKRFSAHEREGVVYLDACIHVVTGGRGSPR